MEEYIARSMTVAALIKSLRSPRIESGVNSFGLPLLFLLLFLNLGPSISEANGSVKDEFVRG